METRGGVRDRVGPRRQQQPVEGKRFAGAGNRRAPSRIDRPYLDAEPQVDRLVAIIGFVAQRYPCLRRGAGKIVLGEVRAVAGRIAVRSEEHTSELQSLMRISYAVFCLKKKNETRIK